MPSKTKTALAALFILGPVSVVVLAGPNNRTDDRGSVRAVSLSADARAAARKSEPADSLLYGQNEKCYWWGRCDIINDENTRLHN
jgi:hypothetical protein